VPRSLDESQRAKIAKLSAYFDWLVFASPNAVDFFFSEYFKINSDLRDLGPVKFAAVGPATAHKLCELHLKVDLQPEVYTTEKLADAFATMNIRSSRFCLAHGNLAEPFLADHLRRSGAAMLEEWTIYETVPETDDATGARARYLREGAHWITFTSASTVENWHALQLQPAGGSPEPKAVSIGPVTTAKLRSLDYQVLAEAPVATLDSLVETICGLAID
jgi:uroporphyrinogen III methyltransferase/synthase